MSEEDEDFELQMIGDDKDCESPFNVVTPGFPDFVCKYVTENELNVFFNFSDKSSINILQINCRSIKKNHSSIANLLNMLKVPITVIAVSETWLTGIASIHRTSIHRNVDSSQR